MLFIGSSPLKDPKVFSFKLDINLSYVSICLGSLTLLKLFSWLTPTLLSLWILLPIRFSPVEHSLGLVMILRWLILLVAAEFRTEAFFWSSPKYSKQKKLLCWESIIFRYSSLPKCWWFFKWDLDFKFYSSFSLWNKTLFFFAPFFRKPTSFEGLVSVKINYWSPTKS